MVELDSKDDELLSSGNPPETSGFELKRILVPIDFSDCSKKALQYAIPFARQFGAELTLLHVVQVNYYAGDFGTVDVALLEGEMRKNGQLQLDSLAAEMADRDIYSKTEVRTGRTTSEIVNLARETNVDLIILATHGHTGLKHVLLGSVAENVVRHAPCPVLIVRELEHDFVPA